MSERDNTRRPPANEPEMERQGHGPNAWPRYVRVLAMLHVLSRPIGFLGFLGLCVAGGLTFVRHGKFDFLAVSMFIAALGCPVLGASYRRWFENWGRRRWPDGKYVPSDASAMRR